MIRGREWDREGKKRERKRGWLETHGRGEKKIGGGLLTIKITRYCLKLYILYLMVNGIIVKSNSYYFSLKF